MSDRELLELAAKAAGIVQTKALMRSDLGLLIDNQPPTLYCVDCKVWNPLTEDGDALRLAVKLGLAVVPYPIYAEPKHAVIAKVYEHRDILREKRAIEEIEVYEGDPMKATRSAIVKAAAEIGRGLAEKGKQ